MDLEHRVTFHAWSEPALIAWARLGFELLAGLNTVVVRESHPQWIQLKTLIAETDCFDFITAVFDAHEIDSAETLAMRPAWHHGYPQPESDFGYLDATYDLRAYCPHCGGGASQRAPFRMKSEPKWGRRSILQLNWVFDQYFVTLQLWETVFKPFGIGSCEVLAARTQQPLSTVVQLVVPEIVDLEIPDVSGEQCNACNRVRYLPIEADFFPRPMPVNAPMFRSRQSFGSGASSWNLVLCTQAMRQALVAAGVKGVDFEPCQQ